MKRIIAMLLSFIILFVGCTENKANQDISDSNKNISNDENIDKHKYDFNDLSDIRLRTCIEEDLYENLVDTLDNDKYFVENIKTVYISKEYLDELSYNSQANIYFGYTLDQLNEAFGDEKYIFTLGDNGKTIVKKFEAYDDTYDKVIKNVAVGTGVILVSVTITVVTGGVGAGAVSLVFASSAKSAMLYAGSGALFSGVTSAAITGIETKDLKKTIDSAVLGASDGFKWGAICGTLKGASEGLKVVHELKGATINGLTLDEACLIQKDSKYPVDIIKQFHSKKEYEVFKEAGLKCNTVSGKKALIQDIDWKFIGDKADGRTNAQRVKEGLAPLDKTGHSYELHHIGQKADSPLAILTSKQHKGNFPILHKNTGSGGLSEINRTEFAKEKRQFWQGLLELAEQSGGIK